MSILIKGMEMPKSCDECRIMVFEDTNCVPELFCGCPIVFKAHPQGVGHRPDYCPLVEVPEQMKWIPVTERLPECDLGTEVGNIEWISCGMVHAGCFGRGGKYRDAYFRTWTDAEEGMDAKEADYWRAVTLPEPPETEN